MNWILPPWLSVPLAFLKRIPWQLWLGLALVLGVWCYGHNQYNAGRASRNAEVTQYKAAAEAWEAELNRTLAQLADADHAAKVAIAAKVEAEKAAAKRLKEREKEWKRLLAKPENKKWADEKIPEDVAKWLLPCEDARAVCE